MNMGIRDKVVDVSRIVFWCVIIFTFCKYAEAQLADVPPPAGENALPQIHKKDFLERAAEDTGKPLKKKNKIKIAKSVQCANDVERFCPPDISQNNFKVVQCLQQSQEVMEKVTTECHNYIWHYKFNLTRNDGYSEEFKNHCSNELAQIEDCRTLKEGTGLRIPCLLEHRDEINSQECQHFLNRMGAIIFSDYRFLNKFMTNCTDDIVALKCGRNILNEDDLHNQGHTIKCLDMNKNSIKNKGCRRALKRVKELQSDDYHHDRPLFYACQDDRETFCKAVVSGDGKVYACLVKHISDEKMSTNCKKNLELREQDAAEDVKIDKLFYESCKADIQDNKCNRFIGSQDQSLEEDLSRSHVLLCLEDAKANDKKLHPECEREMFELRKVLMSTFKITPELVKKCSNEIQSFCGSLDSDGNTIPCLMRAISESKNKNKFGAECKAEVSKLLNVVNVGEDIRLDRPLHRACGDVVTAACRDRNPGHGDVITCLLENIDHEDMTDECEDHLLQIQYFAAREFKLDSHLYKNCKKDAETLCHVQNFNLKSTAPENGPLTFACLHRHLRSEDTKDPKLSKHCGQEVRRVLKERAMRIKLMPEVEDACLRDLADLCSDDKEHEEVGGEMACLQTNLEDLSEKCKEVMSAFTEEQGDNLELDRILMKACTPMINKFCKDKLENDGMASEVLDCLIEYKNAETMDAKCAVGINHHQLISLKDFRFNHKFRKNCQDAVTKLCKKKTKYDVVACLSEHVRNDTLMEKEHRVAKPCRRELQFELLQRGESINLDPELKKQCQMDVKKFCTNVDPGQGAVIECLKTHKTKLSKPCHKMIFKREQEEVVHGDYVLLRTCKQMIKEHCHTNMDEAEILDCLKEHKDDEDFDASCRKIVLRRQVELTRDIRLNPHLMKSCRTDIPKYCSNLFDKSNPHDEEFEGKVINCLKKHYINKGPVKGLSKDCELEIRSRIKQAALDINQNPVVMKTCKQDIKSFCLGAAAMNVVHMEIGDTDGGEGYKTFGEGTIIECLKRNFQNLKVKSCKEEIAFLISESRVDIHVDPLLHSACQQDLISLCQSVTPGQGRQMACLLAHLEKDPDSMTTSCRGRLTRTKTLWEMASEIAPAETFSEFYEEIRLSPARNYILAVLFTVVGIIFIVGITCGRVTKRVRAEVKNK